MPSNIFEGQDAITGTGATDRLGIFDLDRKRVGEEFDEGGEVGAEDLARHDVIDVGAGLEAGDAEVDEIPRVGFGGIDGGEQGNGGMQLLAAFVGRRVGKLIGQLEDFVIAPCGHLPTSSTNLFV